MYKHSLQEGKIGNLTIKNRFVMPGMGVNHNGTVDDVTIEWYAARAKGGFGLIITEFNAVDEKGKAVPGEALITDDARIPEFAKLPERIHQYGCKLFMQIHHAGRETNPMFLDGQMPVSASAVACPVNRVPPIELTTEEVYELIEKFGDAALRAKKAGFDGVEVHGGHGYLPTQFMSSYVNKRTDEFGGDLIGRAKFGVELVRNIKEKCGEDFPVCFRISGDERVDGGRQLQETVMIAKLLEKAGVDVFNMSTGVYATMPYIIASNALPQAYNIDAAIAVKKAVNVPVIGVGRFNDPYAINSVIEDSLCDFVILGRASIADPEFPNKVKEGRTDEISPCISCLTRCQGMPGSDPEEQGISCAINPFSGHETTMKIDKTENRKSVVVIGAGVGGLETAWVSAARGHKVTLIEKDKKLGGQALLASVPPNKSDLTRVIKYYSAMCKKYGVDVRLGEEATKESVLALNPDIVVLATGGVPVEPSIPNEGIPVASASDLLAGKCMAGNRVLVVGGGLVGLETAEFLVSQLRQATVIEMKDSAGEGLSDSVKFFMFKSLRENGVDIKTGTKVEKFTSDGAVCSTASGEIVLSGYDMVVLAMGTRAYNPLEAELAGAVSELYIVGDATGKMASIREAVDAAAKLAIKI